MSSELHKKAIERISPEQRELNIRALDEIYSNPILIEGYVCINLFDILLNEVAWVNRDAPRDECFMALEPGLEYTYGKHARTYNSVPMHVEVLDMLNCLNSQFRCQYNVCFLNYYSNERQHLGWHADDSPEMDLDHPIAVISFGAERYIWVKNKDFKGTIPEDQKYLLKSGSLFIMPAGYQKEHLHRIPKHDRVCGGRISLTFRKLIKHVSDN